MGPGKVPDYMVDSNAFGLFSFRLALLDMIEIRLSDFDEKTASDSEDKVIAIENLQCLCREYQQRAKEILGIIRNATSENQVSHYFLCSNTGPGM